MLSYSENQVPGGLKCKITSFDRGKENSGGLIIFLGSAIAVQRMDSLWLWFGRNRKGTNRSGFEDPLESKLASPFRNEDTRKPMCQWGLCVHYQTLESLGKSRSCEVQKLCKWFDKMEKQSQKWSENEEGKKWTKIGFLRKVCFERQKQIPIGKTFEIKVRKTLLLQRKLREITHITACLNKF